MTRLYREVPITSAEQAEALPEGTIIHGTNPSMGDRKSVAVKHGGDWWGDDCDVNFLGNSGKVGWTALVPIEAEEETLERQRACQAVPEVLHRFTTPWTLYTPQEDPQ